MKRLLLSMVLVCMGCAFAAGSPPRAKFTLLIIDADTGMPVSNAVVKTVFQHQYDPFNSEQNKIDRQEKTVDENGYLTFSGTDFNGSVGASVYADGYYTDWGGVERMNRNRILNRWEPWDPLIEVRMRKTNNPVPMVHCPHKSNWMKMPEKDKPIGFDLELRDWVAPYGKGQTSDFVFHPYRIDTDEEIRFGYKLTFSNPLDGIQQYTPPEGMRSSYIFPYLASTNGYASSLEKIKIDPHRGRVETDMSKQNNYIFRVRSYENEKGNVVGSYGRIKGEITMSGQFGLQFEYWFNPVPNERSLEYSGENLLKK